MRVAKSVVKIELELICCIREELRRDNEFNRFKVVVVIFVMLSRIDKISAVFEEAAALREDATTDSFAVKFAISAEFAEMFREILVAK